MKRTRHRGRLGVIVFAAVALASQAAPASAHFDSGSERLWDGIGANAAGVCVRVFDQQQHGGGTTLGREVQTAGMFTNYGSCAGFLDSPAWGLRHLGWIYWAPFRGAAGNVCVKGGYNYNQGGEDNLVYRDNVNAWSAWCGSQGTWVTHDTQQEVWTSSGWVVAYLRPATAHPYPS